MCSLFSSKQWEYIRKAGSFRWGIKTGAVRSGKSYVDLMYTIPSRINAVRNEDGLNVILGVSNGTIERNVLQPMRKHFGDAMVGSINNSSNVVNLFGDKAVCIGAEKITAVDKIRGMSIKYAYGDEIAAWHPDVFMMLESRLDKEYSRFDGTCNPEGPNHWFKKWIDNPKISAYVQEYQLFDNPFLSESFIESLCNEYEGTVYYQRYILGKWAIAEGLVYPHYQDAISDPPENADFDKYCISIDYGTENPFAAILFAHNQNDNVWYGIRGYYYSGRETGVPKTDEDYANDLEDFAADVLKLYASKNKKLLTIIDPSAASFITTLARRKKFSIIRGDNDVLDGIRETAVAIRMGFIKVSPSIKTWSKEAGGYSWDKKASDTGVERVVKQNDHDMDLTRYFVKTLHVVETGMKYLKRKSMGFI